MCTRLQAERPGRFRTKTVRACAEREGLRDLTAVCGIVEIVIPGAGFLDVRLNARRYFVAHGTTDAFGLSVQIFYAVVAVAFLRAERQFLRVDLEGRQPEPRVQVRHRGWWLRGRAWGGSRASARAH